MNTDTTGIQLSPKVRHVLGIVLTLIAIIGGYLVTLPDLPDWIGVVVSGAATVGAYLGLVPGQVGGTQHGVTNPAITEPPAANVDERGFSEISFLLVAAGIGLGILIAVLLL